MDREQRRAVEQPGLAAKLKEQQRKLIKDGTPQDVTSERAKSQRHGKVTADKWNQ
jgi:hypothetical protein